MNVGDYVRFDYHRVSVPIQIARITETHYDDEDDSICYSTDIGLVIDESNLVKEPSQTIKRLIKIGDYVNGYKVTDIEKDGKIILGNEEQYYGIYEKDIRTIVTKEQFESMEYKGR